MNNGFWNQIKGNFKQVTGEIQEQWGKLTNDEIDEMNGEREQLVGKIQERYGIAQEEAERQVEEWVANVKDKING
ncbi:MAG: CsbD family protein [Chloroflexota bacterium]